ncbi:hypothetical protein JRO89_XS09G0213200 [Xanthoceras sorbifolium]|uniref:Ankyrin repeat protein n=1 Tax=Xanthoceras sorbifolium TaxID=99658 RepID=A0ABQ8HMB9_9ROSI|nr:hypothetical protein JRO89_XS09G0213200 [Xanthoceras sorbifolium]
MLSMTALHVAAFSGHSKFVEKLIEQMTPEEVAVKDFSGNTALHHAATTGNLNVAIALLRKNCGLTEVQGNQGFLPLLTAVVYGADKGKEMAWFLAMRTENPFVETGTTSVCNLLLELTHAGFHDITLYLLRRFPELATYREDKSGRNILSILAVRPTDFLSGTKLNLAPFKQLSSVRGDVEDPPEKSDDLFSRTRSAKVCKWSREQTWKVVIAIESNKQKIHIVGCKGTGESLNYYRPLFSAAQSGDWKSAKSFIDRDPNALTARIRAVTSETVFHVAALSCQWGFVLKLLELNVSPELLAAQDDLGNTVLHYVAQGGSIKTVKALVKNNSDLLQIVNNIGHLPLFHSLFSDSKELVWYLTLITRVESPSSLEILRSLIGSGYTGCRNPSNIAACSLDTSTAKYCATMLAYPASFGAAHHQSLTSADQTLKYDQTGDASTASSMYDHAGMDQSMQPPGFSLRLEYNVVLPSLTGPFTFLLMNHAVAHSILKKGFLMDKRRHYMKELRYRRLGSALKELFDDCVCYVFSFFRFVGISFPVL